MNSPIRVDASTRDLEDETIFAFLSKKSGSKNLGTLSEKDWFLSDYSHTAVDIESLIDQLWTDSSEGKSNAAGGLWSLVFLDADNSNSIATGGGFTLLIDLLKNGCPQGKSNSAGLPWSLAYHDAFNRRSIGGECAMRLIDLLINLLESGSRQGKTNAAGALMCQAEDDAGTCTSIASRKGIVPLIDLLKYGSSQGKTNATGVLMILA